MSDSEKKELEIVPVVKHRRTSPIFDAPFREVVFRMWIDGNTLVEIANKFKGTEKECSIQMLAIVKREDDWDIRREDIEEAARKESDEQIKRVNKEKIEALNMLVDTVASLIKRQIEEFVKDPELAIATVDPKNKPLWFVNKIDELEKLFKLHEFVVNNRPDKVINDNSSYSMQQLNVGTKGLDVFPQEMQSKLLRILAKKDDIVEIDKDDFSD